MVRRRALDGFEDEHEYEYEHEDENENENEYGLEAGRDIWFIQMPPGPRLQRGGRLSWPCAAVAKGIDTSQSKTWTPACCIR